MNYKKLNESNHVRKEVAEFLASGNEKVIVPPKKMLKIAAADVRSRGSIAWGGQRARNADRFA
jgi:hypothetical protein